MSLSPAQIEARKHGLGGTDAAAIIGLNPYKGPFDVYARFHLPVSPDDLQEESEAAEWGNILEAPIAAKYARERDVVVLASKTSTQHPKYPFLIANTDRTIYPKGTIVKAGVTRPDAVLEVKTAGLRVAHRWGDPEKEPDKVPEEYELQVRHYLAVTDLPWGDIAVLIGGQDFRVYRIHRDMEIERELIEAEVEFWEKFILTGQEPPLVSPKIDGWLKILYPRNRLPERDPTDALVDLANRYALAREAEKEAKGVKEEIAVMLKAGIADSAGFRWGKKGKATWTNNKDGSEVDWTAVASTLAPSPDALAKAVLKHTTSTTGDRVLRVTVEPKISAPK